MQKGKKLSLLHVLLFACGFMAVSSNIFPEFDPIDIDIDRDITDISNLDNDAIIDAIFADLFCDEHGNSLFKTLPDIIKGNDDDLGLPFWKRTYGARTRDTLFLIPNRRLIFDKPGIDVHFFFNRATHLPVMPAAMLNLETIHFLKDFADGLFDFDDDETNMFGTLFKALPYLEKMSVQEHKIGAMFNAGMHWGRWGLQLDTVLLLAERNYWLCKSDQKELKEVLCGFDDVGLSSVMRTKFGLSDTRLKLGYNVLDNKFIQAAIGVEGIIPTSRLFSKRPSNCIESKVGADRKALLNDLLASGRRILIEPKLGTGHWGLGAFAEMRMQVVPDKLDFWTRFSFDYLFSGNEHRFMPSRDVLSLLNLGPLVSNEEGIIPESFPINKLFPYLARVRVRPGHIYNGAAGLNWHIDSHWSLYGGYDYYHQQGEHISGVCLDGIDVSKLLIDQCRSSRVVQHKVFAGASYTKKGKHRDWTFSLGGDYSFSNVGTSRDWTVKAGIGIKF